MTIAIHHGDCLEVIPRLVAEGIVCDAVVTDAPYHLLQLSRGGSLRQNNPKSKYGWTKARAGFMGQTWDGGDIAFRPETWATIATIMRPGAFLVAFGGTRTYHRLVCAIEDAGFVVQDQIAWMFGSGFPKRRDMLKPAFEPICLAYKPGGKRTMQVDECRIATSTEDKATINAKHAGMDVETYHRPVGVSLGLSVNPMPLIPAAAHALGRWPANVAHDGSDEVLAAFPDALGAVSNGRSGLNGYDGGWGAATQLAGYADTGSAARFFKSCPLTEEDRRFHYSSKADRDDCWGSRHPTVKPIDLIRWLVRLVTPPGGLVLDPFAGSGTTGAAAFAEGRNAILIEREPAYVADIRERMAWYQGEGMHSTAAKARRTEAKPLGGLFERPYDADADLFGSYYAAIDEIGRRVKAGEAVPECMLRKATP